MAQPLSDDQAPLDQVVTTGLIVGWEWVASSSAEDQGNASTRPADSPDAQAAAPAAAAASPGSAAQPSAGPPVAARQPEKRYQVRRLLGKGGMGEIQLRKDLTIGREVAMKRMLPAHATNPVARARFIREAQVQGQLEHPSIVPVYDLAVETDGSVFFTMKRLRGRTLEDILRVLKQGSSAERSQFPLHRLLQNFSSVCLAVEFAHSRGVIHRDLKPAEIRAVAEPGAPFPPGLDRAGKRLAAFSGRCASRALPLRVERTAASRGAAASGVRRRRRHLDPGTG